MEVHRELGRGFQELIHQRALEYEFHQKSISFCSEFKLPIFYNSINVGYRRVDFLVEDLIPVEIKAVKQLEDAYLAQGLNYLEAFNLEVGLLINF